MWDLRDPKNSTKHLREHERWVQKQILQQPLFRSLTRDYDHWSMIMKNLLRFKEYWVAVEKGYNEQDSRDKLTPAEITSPEEMKLKDLKAKNYLFQSIDKSILKTITQKEISKQLWDSMKVKCQGNARVKRAQLNRLRQDFEVLEAKDIDQLSVDALQSSLLVHEQKFKAGGEEEQALKVTHEDHYGGRGQRRIGLRGGVEESEEMVLMAYIEKAEDDKDVVWYIDSGCSNHMCGDLSLFCDVTKGNSKVVRLGNSASMEVVGKGSVCLTIKGINYVV
ncbi:uncharacterized protein LOC141664979 [Apium graveolens]|uniref:uncharacterized protein LOC141664979 n=1 Tax=Apium graveolens TaxID=4045 RepID=UPI003D78E6F0